MGQASRDDDGEQPIVPSPQQPPSRKTTKPKRDTEGGLPACCKLFGDNDETNEGVASFDANDTTTTTPKELLVIGSGPHGLALMLRLLHPTADLMPDKERHVKLDHHSTKIRKIPDVRKYTKKLTRGPGVVLKPNPKMEYTEHYPPPIDLSRLRQSTLVVDRSVPLEDDPTSSGWLRNWHQNFEAIQISYLRSPSSAHLDAFDPRALDVWAEALHRSDDLISLPYLKQRNKDFHGPYQAPSTKLFRDFHHVLAQAYGIDDLVQHSAEVVSIEPRPPLDEGKDPYFEVKIRRVTKGAQPTCGSIETASNDDDTVTVRTKRVVCALGPMFQTGTEFWEPGLPKSCRHRVLHCHEIVPWLKRNRKLLNKTIKGRKMSLLIVGGGITSTHLTLLAASESWCESVALCQRSCTKERQFDLDNKWMGPNRGRYLDEFWALDWLERAQFLKQARRGGSVPPELVEKLQQQAEASDGTVQVKQEVQISNVSWDTSRKQFRVQLDDGSDESYHDMIWLSTGADNDLDLYPCLRTLQEALPVGVVGGLPVLDEALSWKAPEESDADVPEPEPSWKTTLRQRLFVMGSLAGLQLGPDALNLMGARQGAVRVATAIRNDVHYGKSKESSPEEAISNDASE